MEEMPYQSGGVSATKKPSSEMKNEIIPLSPRRSRLRESLLSKIVPWEKITDSLENFPYYIAENTKAQLMDCVASHLKNSRLRKQRSRLKSSSQRILLQSVPGTNVYRERLVSAVAREFQVPLLKLDDLAYQGEEEEDDSDDEVVYSMAGEDYGHGVPPPPYVSKFRKGNPSQLQTLKKGNRVTYVGKAILIEEANNRTLPSGQRGEVCEVNGERVAVAFSICGLKTKKAMKDEKSTETFRQALVTWLDVKDVMKDFDTQTHDFCIAMEDLYGVLESQQPVIVYFLDSFVWPFLGREEYILNLFQEGVVMICAQNRQYEPEKMNKYDEGMRKCIGRPLHRVPDMHKLFTNVICIKPPKDQDLLNTFNKQIEEDGPRVISEGNLSRMHQVLNAHNLSCMSLEHTNIEDVLLTREDVEKIVGWAINHYLASCPSPDDNEGKFLIPHESIKLAILRLKEEKEEETQSKKLNNFQDLATGRHEKSLVSSVVRSEDIGVKFDDVGALEHVKKILNEIVILPLRRPELFSHGNLLRPTKGMLLFGPPGTGKTLIAKALATESGANFINITTATITSKWHGETENLTRALFSYASKLAPVIIFVDEVDSLLGTRGHHKHATSRLNEFMAAWDGLTSKESQQILVIGATNRPFDIDEAVIRRMPRRIYVGLPELENRSKILKVLLKNENLESGFSFEQLAEATAGYSGSDLKNLCVSAAYRPLEELLEEESKGEKSDGVPAPALRPLNLNDFLHSRDKVRPSVSRNAPSIIKLREWNEQYGERDCQDSELGI